jgi:hypothetical protein
MHVSVIHLHAFVGFDIVSNRSVHGFECDTIVSYLTWETACYV